MSSKDGLLSWKLPRLVIRPNVTGHRPLHEGAECGIGSRLQDKIEVIGHGADTEYLDGNIRFILASRSRNAV